MRYYTFYIAAACVLAFIIQSVVPGFTDAFLLDSAKVLYEPWLLVTSMFLHGGLEHILYNMFALLLFGIMLEHIIGGKRFIRLYFMAGIIASIGSAIFYPQSLGASGAIYGIIGCLAVLRPRMTVWVFNIPMPMIIAAVLWAAIGVFGIFFPSTTADAAHLFGMFFGMAYAFPLRRAFGERHERRAAEKVLSEEEMEEWEGKYMRQ